MRFDEPLRIAVNINIMALQDILKLSKEIRNLKVSICIILTTYLSFQKLKINRYFQSFVHISTAYSNCAGRKVVDEIFYKTPITGDKLNQLVKSLDDDYINEITPK